MDPIFERASYSLGWLRFIFGSTIRSGLYEILSVYFGVFIIPYLFVDNY